MQVKRVIERDDGSVVFQGVLEGPELAFVIECGLDAIFQMTTSPFVSQNTHEVHDIHNPPDEQQ